jgi:hypothetical protein
VEVVQTDASQFVDDPLSPNAYTVNEELCGDENVLVQDALVRMKKEIVLWIAYLEGSASYTHPYIYWSRYLPLQFQA